MAGTYSVGSVFLRVIPTFVDVQNEAAQHGEKLGKQVGKAYNKGFGDESGNILKDALGGNNDAESEEAGKKSGKKFSGAFQSSINSSVQGSLKALGDNVDKTLGKAAKKLNSLKSIKFGANFDGGKALADLGKFVAKMEALQRDTTVDIQTRFNAAEAAAQARTVLTAVEKTLKPVKIDVNVGAFEDTFRSRLAALRKSLPDIELKVDSSDADRAFFLIAARIKELDGMKLGVDFDDDEALAEMAKFETELRALEETDLSVSARVNLAAALAEVEGFRAAIAAKKPIEIPVEAGLGGAFEAELQSRVKAALELLPKANIQADTDPAVIKLNELRARMEALNGFRVNIDGDASHVLREMDEIEARLRELSQTELTPELNMIVSKALANNEAFRKAVQNPLDVKVEADLGSFRSEISAALAKVDKTVGHIKIDGDTSEAMLELAEIQARAAALKVEIDAGLVGGNRALAEMKALEQAAKALDRKDVDIEVRTNARRVAADLAVAGDAAKKSGRDGQLGANSFRAFNGVLLTALALGPALVPVLASLAGGLAAVGSQALVGAAGLGVMALAFSGIGGAVKELGDKSPERNILTANRAIEGAQRSLDRAREASARSAEDSARRVQDAQDGIGDAERQLTRARAAAARGAEQAARRVADAQEAILDAEERVSDAVQDAADARERAARDIESAIRSQRDAERSLLRIQEDALKAQQALTKAKEDAAKGQQDLAFQIRQGAIEERQGLIDVFEATVAYNNARADGGATNLDKENASIALESARLSLEKTRVENQRLADEKAKQDKDGIDGSEQVVAAQERITETAQARADAEEKVADAGAAADRARVDGAKTVADAQKAIVDAQDGVADARQGLVDAERDQDQQRIDSAESVADAQRGIADANRAVTDALAEQKQSAEASAQSVADAQRGLTEAYENMAQVLEQNYEEFNKLGPAGQKFALFIHSLRDDMAALRETAQAGLLPGVQEALEMLLSKYGPGLNQFVGTISKTLGDIAVKAATALSGPQWESFFSTFSQVAPGLLEDIASIIGNVATGIGQLFVAFAPFTEKFSDGLVSLTEKFVAFAAGLTDNPAFQDFLAYLMDSGPLVLQFISSLFDALLNLGVALAPYADLLLKGLIGILDFIGNADPDVLQDIVVLIVALGVGIQVIFSILSTAAVIGGFVGALALGETVAVVAAVVGGLLVLGGALVALWLGSETFRDVVTGVFNDVKAGAERFFEVIQPGLQSIKDGFNTFIENITPAISRLVEAFGLIGDALTEFDVAGKLGAVFNVVASVVGTLLGILGGLLGGVIDIVSGIFQVIIAVFTNNTELMENGFADIWNGVVGVFKTIFGPIVEDVGNFIQGIIDWFAHLYDVLVGHSIVPDLVNAIIDWFTDLYDRATKWISDLIESIVSFFVDLAVRVIVSVAGFVADVVQNYKDMWEKYISPIFDALSKGWSDLITALTKAYDTYLAPLIAAFIYILNNPTDSLKFVFDTVVGGIKSKWDTVMTGIKTAYDTYLKPTVDAFVKILNDPTTGLGSIFATVVSGIGTIWDGLKAIFKDPIKFVIETVIRDGLVGNYNKLVTSLKGPDSLKIDPQQFTLPTGFANGGAIGGRFMGPRADNVLIRANPREFMQPVSAVEHYGTDFMEAIRTRKFPKIPGFASGGLVGFGKRLQSLGFRVSEQSQFGGVTPNAHKKGSKHYVDQAIDVNYGASGSPANEKPAIDGIVGLAAEYGLRTIWQSEGHFNHAHFDTGSGPNILGKIGSAIGGAVDGIMNPLETLKGFVDGAFGDRKDGLIGDVAKLAVSSVTELAGSALGNLVTSAGDWVQDKAGNIVGSVKEFFSGSSDVHKIVQDVAKGYGWDTGTAWTDLTWLVNKESSWNPNAQNPTSTAYGLFQFLNGTWPTVGAKKTSDPNAQAVAGLKYIDQRYGSPSKARAFHEKNNSYADGGMVGKDGAVVPTGLYDTGGVVPKGLSQIVNMTGANEQAAVFTTDQWARLEGGGGDTKYEINVDVAPTNATPQAVASEVLFAMRGARRGGVYAGKKVG